MRDGEKPERDRDETRFAPHMKTPVFRFSLVADLHFGSVPDGLAAALLSDIEADNPDLVIVAGDLTMRARRREFDAAREWLRSVDAQTMVLAGNHDLPYVNLWERFANPYKRFMAFTGADAEPFYETEGAAVVGLNTTRSWQPHLSWQEGIARKHSVIAGGAKLAAASPDAFRCVVSHHPLWLGPDAPVYVRPAIGAEVAVRTLAFAGAEVFMSGHVHRGFVHSFEIEGRTCIALGAPTALSSRLRGEENGYWRVKANESDITLTLRRRRETTFFDEKEISFARAKQAAAAR